MRRTSVLSHLADRVQCEYDIIDPLTPASSSALSFDTPSFGILATAGPGVLTAAGFDFVAAATIIS
jgi:hypothetical protein